MMTYSKTDNLIAEPLAALGQEIIGVLAKQFPICMSSDEFHYFPQYRPVRIRWSQWDSFSGKGLTSILADMEKWQQQLHQWQRSRPDPDAAVDLVMLDHVLVTLREQIEWVRPHHFQPTFYLTIASIGLAEALDDSYGAFGRRLATLPAFFRMAKDNLHQVPALYREQGMAMTGKLRKWINKLPLTGAEKPMVDKAFEGFRRHLEHLETTEDFRLPEDVYARIADHHMGSKMGLEEIGWHLDQEVEESAQVLAQTASSIAPGKPWPQVWQALPNPSVDSNDGLALFRGAITKLKAHCIAHHFFDPGVIANCDVAVRTIPEHLMPIRANAAYSMPAGYPPRGGTFYIKPLNGQRVPRGLMLLTAHETYPGHHLLDTLRWQHDNPLRRSLEFPIFYEGWACFAEEILFDTDLFSGPVDRMLMAKRRYLRALRGRADLNIHSGKSSMEDAAETLCQNGLATRQQALNMVQRYALKPGYQLAYTIGRRKFRQLYTAFLGRGKTPAQFVRKVLSTGEIGFEHLAEKLLY